MIVQQSCAVAWTKSLLALVLALFSLTPSILAQKDDCPKIVPDSIDRPWLLQKIGLHGQPATTVDVTSGDPMAAGWGQIFGKSRLLVDWDREYQPVVTWTHPTLTLALGEEEYGILLPFELEKDDAPEPKDHSDPGSDPVEFPPTVFLTDVELNPLPPGTWPLPMTFVPPNDWGTATSSQAFHPGSGMFTHFHMSGPTLLGTQEIRYVDGTINYYEEYNDVRSSRRHWRITHSVDPRDNLTRYRYLSDGRLEKVELPDGTDQVFDYSPDWIGGTGSKVWPAYNASGSGVMYSGIEVRYVDRATSAVLPGKTTCYLYKVRETVPHGTVTYVGTPPSPIPPSTSVPAPTSPLNGDLLYRIYRARGRYLDPLADPTADVLHNVPVSLDAPERHEVVEYEYVVGTSLLKSVSHFMSDGIEASPTTETKVEPVVTYTYQQTGNRSRVQTETLHMQNDLQFTYSYGLHPTQVDANGQALIIETTRTSPSAAKVTFEMDTRARLIAVTTTPRASGSGYADRASDPAYDPNHDDQPAELKTTYEYGPEWCTCRGKPTAVVDVHSNRRTEYAYEATSGLLTEVRTPNPSGQPGFAVTAFEWEPAEVGKVLDRWRLKRKTNPKNEQWTWSYDSVPRWNFATGTVDTTGLLGTKDEEIAVTSPSVSGSVLSTTQYTETSTLDVSGLASRLDGAGSQTAYAGQLIETEDADGIVTNYAYDARGRLESATTNPSGGVNSIKAEYSFDTFGLLESTTENATSASPLLTTITRDGRGAARVVATVVNGIWHDQRFYFDQWGNLAVTLSTNKSAAGTAPEDFHPSNPRSDTARAWLREEWHYWGGRLLVHLADRRALDRDDVGAISDHEDARFVRSDFTWSQEGWLLQQAGANAALTDYLYDGFGSLFKVTKSGDGSSVQAGKYFVNSALEITRVLDGLGNATVVERNAAGVATSITEPATTGLPPNYPAWTVSRARTEYTTDVLGRTSEVRVYQDGVTDPLIRRTMGFDEIGRPYDIRAYEGSSAMATEVTAAVWTGATTVGQITYPSGRIVERTYDSLKRVQEVRDGMMTPNKVVYEYMDNAPFVARIVRHNWDEVNSVDVERPVEYVRDNLGRVLEMKVLPSVPTPPALPNPVPPSTQPTSPLVHSFAYYTNGATESYTDPTGKVEKFLPDALGRLNERFLPGAAPIWNGTMYLDWMSGTQRTSMLQVDGLGAAPNPLNVPLPLVHATKTIYDFAGRPIIEMDPGASVEPTVGSPHQANARMWTYDAASRVQKLYSPDTIEIMFYRDAAGRVLQRRLNSLAGIIPEIVSALWNHDNFEWDPLGQLTKTNSYGIFSALTGGDEYIEEEFERDVFGRTLRESYQYVAAVGGPDIVSTYVGGDPFRRAVKVDNLLPGDDLTVYYSPDDAGRVASMQWAAGAGASVDLVSYSHEGSRIRKRETTLALGVAGGLTPFEFDTEYYYDVYGRMEAITHDFDANAFVKFEYDSASSLVKEYYNKQGGQDGDRFAYDEHHRLHKAWLGSDTAHLGASSGDDPVGTYVKKLTYGLDAAHNRTEVATEGVPTAEAYTTEAASNRYDTVGGVQLFYDQRGNLYFDGNCYYVYDALNRLSEVWKIVLSEEASSGEQIIASETKFEVSDMTALRAARAAVVARIGAEPDVVERACCPQLMAKRREVISSAVASPLGATTSEASQQVYFYQTAWYLYDSMNRRVARQVLDDGTYFYAWDGWQEAQELVFRGAGSNLTAEMKQFAWGEQLDELVAYRASPNVGAPWVNYYIAEGGAHCPSRVLDEAGDVVEIQEYDPYGRATFFNDQGAAFGKSQVGNAFAWRGLPLDHEAGLIYMRNRFYSPDLGRFTSRDPIGVGGDSVTRFNAYSYGSASPQTQQDPLGLQVVSIQVNAFIEGAWVDAPIGYAEGDGRSGGEIGGTSRVSITINIPLDGGSPSQSVRSDPSRYRSSMDAEPSEPRTSTPDETPLTVSVPNNGVPIEYRGGARGSYPFFLWTPNVDVKYYIDVYGDVPVLCDESAGVRLRIVRFHYMIENDGFPSYEIIANGKVVRVMPAKDDGPGGNLVGPPDHTYHGSGEAEVWDPIIAPDGGDRIT